MKIYKQVYFDKNAWLLDNFEKLNLTHTESLLLLIINFCNEYDKEITYDFLCNKLQIKQNELDNVLASLTGKHYLHIDVNKQGIYYDIDQIFDFDINDYEENNHNDIYRTIEDFLSRPLNPIDRMKVSDLLNTYDENAICDAIRMACAYRKYNLAYVESILRNDRR